MPALSISRPLTLFDVFTVIDVRKQLGLSVGGVSDSQLSTGWWCGERGYEAFAPEAGCHCLVRVLIITPGCSRVPHPGHSGAKVGCEKASFGGPQLLGGGVRRQIQCLLRSEQRVALGRRCHAFRSIVCLAFGVSKDILPMGEKEALKEEHCREGCF